MHLASWVERNRVSRVTPHRWFCARLLPLPVRKVERPFLFEDPTEKTDRGTRSAVYAQVSSADQKASLDREVGRATAWTTARQVPVDKVVTEAGSALNGSRRKLFILLPDPSLHRILVEHRDLSCRFGSEYVQTALATQGRERVVVDAAEVDDELGCDMSDILNPMCAQLYCKRAAENRAKHELAAAATEGPVAP